jgi:hypothetical protein
MQSRILVALAALAAITVALWWSRSGDRDPDVLQVRRIAPTDAILRGRPHHPVDVELELTNTTRRPMELAPLQMSCSCQVAKAPDKIIAAGGNTRMVLSLRYPPAQQSVSPIEFLSPTGELLARTEIVLESDQSPPYFLHCPDVVEITVIDGESDATWSTSATVAELADEPPYVTGVRITDGAGGLSVAVASTEQSMPGFSECRRTYQLTFQLSDAALTSPHAALPQHGAAVLDLRDGAETSIAWKVNRKPPLALVFESSSSQIRGVRRGGARGPVTLHCVPDGSGTLTPDRFESGQPIVASLEPGPAKPQAVEARYEGTAAVIPVLLPIP